jgi:hypothetical protein
MTEQQSPHGSNESIVLDDQFNILLNGSKIGYIEPLGEYNHIIGHIEIESHQRGNGYGKKATEVFLQRAAERGASSVATSVIISPAFEHIARDKLGFSETAPEQDGLYLSKSL